MTSAEERKKILKMVAEGTITAEEAAKLLAALSKGSGEETVPGSAPRWLRVRVTDVESGKQQVNVNLPFQMVRVGLRMGARFAPEMDGIEMEELLAAVQSGMSGKVLDIIDDEDGQHVEIYVE